MNPFFTHMHRVMEQAEARMPKITPAVPIRATGNHRVAQNDEPEPEAMRLEAEAIREFHDDEMRSGIERVGPEWADEEGDEE